ncbi:MAG: hypothetical protein L6R42_000455 [Xanthoria sp. 1 TBL-2021]|nr:MAG: hypothetical protein L6R42_000455 [Xanthoria sp. 1 TBL-2021]
MAGIGEASAILAVAHIGISLSNTLIAYVSEVQDAPFRIQRIGNEVLTTSERLKDIGELVETNGKTQTLSNEGVQSAIRCSADCENILNQLQGVLKKGGWQQRSETQEKEEIDTSLFSSLRWPFSKTKLEVPLAELTRVKLDLMLLFSSAMALGAPSISEKAKFRKDIPGLSRTREWAARMAEQAKERAKDREYDLNFSGRNLDFPQGEPEMLQEFVDFRERRVREQEEQELAERAARLLVEQEASKKKAEEERRELEEKILNKHKIDQMEMEARTAQQKRDLRVELEAAGLEQEQINIVLASSQLNYGETTDRLNIPADRPMNGFKTSDNNREGTERTTSGDDYNQISRKNKKRRLKLPWFTSATSYLNDAVNLTATLTVWFPLCLWSWHKAGCLIGPFTYKLQLL